MTLKPIITEIRERRYSFELNANQVRSLIAEACLAAAGVSQEPDGLSIVVNTQAAATVRFSVHLHDDVDMPRVGVPAADPVVDDETPKPAPQPDLRDTEVPQADAQKAGPDATQGSDTDLRRLHWDALTAEERRIVNHLDKLTGTFSPVQDLNIAQCLFAGVKIPVVASEMGEAPEDVSARFNAMQCDATLGSNGKPSIDGQRRLMVALRYRAGHP